MQICRCRLTPCENAKNTKSSILIFRRCKKISSCTGGFWKECRPKHRRKQAGGGARYFLSQIFFRISENCRVCLLSLSLLSLCLLPVSLVSVPVSCLCLLSLFLSSVSVFCLLSLSLSLSLCLSAACFYIFLIAILIKV